MEHTPPQRLKNSELPRKKVRCAWAMTNDLFIPYHDEEWGVPEHNDQKLFEMLNLEGAQAGLSWLTILKKRDGYRAAFADFDAEKVANYTPEKEAELMLDDGIVRNKLKIHAVVKNAQAFLEVQKEFGSFDEYLWSFVKGKVIQRERRDDAMAISEVMSTELKKRGFTFVGATSCFALMQAVGMVNDHETNCFRAYNK